MGRDALERYSFGPHDIETEDRTFRVGDKVIISRKYDDYPYHNFKWRILRIDNGKMELESIS